MHMPCDMHTRLIPGIGIDNTVVVLVISVRVALSVALHVPPFCINTGLGFIKKFLKIKN